MMQLQQHQKHKLSRSLILSIILTLIIILSTILRLVHIHRVRNVDEIFIVKYALEFASGTIHLPWYNWPAQSLMRIDGVIFAIIHYIQNIFHGNAVTPLLTSPIDTHWFTIAHCITVFISLLCILATWNVIILLTKSTSTATLGAAILAISSLHVTHSRFATPDMLLTTLLMCGVWIAILMLHTCNRKKRKILSIVAGICIGISIATKYTGAIVMFPFFLGILGSSLVHKKIWGISHLFLLLSSALIAHIILNPFFFADIHLVKAALTQESNPVRLGVDWGNASNSFLRNIMYYLRGLQAWSGTSITWIAGITAILLTMYRKTIPYLWLCTLSALAYLFGISMLGLHWSRWALPLTPFVAIFASIGLWRAWIILCAIKTPHWLAYTSTALCLAVITFPQLVISVVSVSATRSTYTDASTCIATHLPKHSRIIADGYLFNTADTRTVDEIGIATYRKTITEWRAEGARAILVSTKRFSQAKKQALEYQYILDFFSELKTQGKLLCTISPTQDSILDHKKDWGVYRYIWQHQNNLNLFTIIEGDAYSVYDISVK